MADEAASPLRLKKFPPDAYRKVEDVIREVAAATSRAILPHLSPVANPQGVTELVAEAAVVAALPHLNAMAARIAELERQMEIIDRVVANCGFRREHGHRGARGVAWLGERYDGAIEELQDADREIKELQQQRDAVLALCDEADASGNSSDWDSPSGDAIRAIYGGGQ